MTKAMRFFTIFLFGLVASVQAVPAYGFQYGQCLLGKTDSFNNELREYRNVAFAKAAIKKLAFEQNPDLLKWNYDTTKLVYDLVVVHADLIRLKNIYKIIRAESPKSLAQIQDFFDGTSGHVALAKVDEDGAADNDNEKSVSDLIDLLEDLTDNSMNAQREISMLRNSFEDDRVKDALGDLYDRIQEASVGATPVEPESIEQWIALAESFQGARMVPAGCEECRQVGNVFNKVVLEWGKVKTFPELKDFNELSDRLPPLAKINYPKLPPKAKEAQKVVEYHYLRTMENFLFSRAGVTQEQVAVWIKKDPNHKIILKQADQDKDFRSASQPAVKLYKYIQSKERVLGNAFDHFVWEGQEGTELEKSIDGVARTLYGEAESCQLSGASQFEAIAAVIAARSISVDQDNQQKNIFLSLANFGIGVIDVLSPLEIAPLSSYESGASDFGRTREIGSNPIVSEMSTPAQVVSKPGQFSVWKIGNQESLEVSRWIRLPTNLGYPKDLKTVVSGALGKDVDPAQRKVLCPNNKIFNDAVAVAKELVTDYTAYANKYRFHQGNKRVVPYFYTHGANIRLGFAKQVLPAPSFSSVTAEEGVQNLPIYVGPSACVNMKLYKPKIKMSPKKATGKKKKPGKKR